MVIFSVIITNLDHILQNKRLYKMNKKTKICAIVAVGPENVIGKNNVMPWYCPADLKYFKITTTPYPCIFGKNTFTGMNNQPLKNRINIICSSKHNDEMIDLNYWHASSIESAIANFKHYDKIFICGGAQIYKYVLSQDLIDIFYLTKIESPKLQKQIIQNPEQYTYFPVDINTFFTPNKWAVKQITVQTETLPKNPPHISQTFWQYTRKRQLG